MSDWLTLSELSGQYRAAADKLRARMGDIRKELSTATDPEEIWQLKQRIKELTPILTEMNKLAELTERYYDRGYYRDEQYTTNGIKIRFPEGTEKAKSNQDRTGGTYTDSDGYTHRVYSQGAVTSRRSERARCKQVDRVPDPQTGDREGAKVRQISVNDKQLNRLLAKLKF